MRYTSIIHYTALHSILKAIFINERGQNIRNTECMLTSTYLFALYYYSAWSICHGLCTANYVYQMIRYFLCVCVTPNNWIVCSLENIHSNTDHSERTYHWSLQKREEESSQHLIEVKISLNQNRFESSKTPEKLHLRPESCSNSKLHWETPSESIFFTCLGVMCMHHWGY